MLALYSLQESPFAIFIKDLFFSISKKIYCYCSLFMKTIVIDHLISFSHLDRWHFPMLNDRVRNGKFEKAIENRVKNGCDTVLDIGTGTGLLRYK